MDPITTSDYRAGDAIPSRDLDVQSIKQAQAKYKKVYDRKSVPSRLQVGDWVLVRFAQEEVGKMRKLSRPWHDPYRILSREEPDVTVTKVYFPEDKAIRVHLSRVTPCPSEFPRGFYWYGTKRHSPGRPPKWVQQLLDTEIPSEVDVEQSDGDSMPTNDSELQATSDGHSGRHRSCHYMLKSGSLFVMSQGLIPQATHVCTLEVEGGVISEVTVNAKIHTICLAIISFVTGHAQ